MVGNVGMFPMFGNYYSQAMGGDLYDMDFSYGYGNGMYGAMMPFMGAGGAYNYQHYYDQMKDYMKFQYGYQRDAIELQRDNYAAINSPDGRIAKAATYLAERIQLSEQEQIPAAIEAFKEALRAKYPNASADEIAGMIGEEWSKYSQVPLTQAIRQNASSSFWQGFKQIVSLGMADRVTAEENISKIYNQPVSRSEQAKKAAGRMAGGAALGALGFVFGPIGFLTTAIGAILGGASVARY